MIGTDSGYSSRGYAESLAEFGTPLELTGCGSWILVRSVPQTPLEDGMGCYPLFSCSDWSQLESDLARLLESRLVSVALVTDPFGDYDEHLLRRCFPDRLIPFKSHFIVDLKNPPRPAEHHRRRLRRALEQVDVEHCDEPLAMLNDWLALYSNLVSRHGLTGMRAYSPQAFAKQFALPGLDVFRASHRGECVGVNLTFTSGEFVYYHLSACSSLGYTLGASYALQFHTIRYFSGRADWYDLGAGAGLSRDASEGLFRFKAGWTSETRMAYFCGRILDRQAYRSLAASAADSVTDYFPVYRAGEFD